MDDKIVHISKVKYPGDYHKCPTCSKEVEVQDGRFVHVDGVECKENEHKVACAILSGHIKDFIFRKSCCGRTMTFNSGSLGSHVQMESREQMDGEVLDGTVPPRNYHISEINVLNEDSKATIDLITRKTSGAGYDAIVAKYADQDEYSKHHLTDDDKATYFAKMERNLFQLCVEDVIDTFAHSGKFMVCSSKVPCHECLKKEDVEESKKNDIPYAGHPIIFF